MSSEGEKAGGSRVSQDEEEGREAEASPARRAAGSRRSPRSNRARSRVTPIVWEPSVSMMAARGQYCPFDSVYGNDKFLNFPSCLFIHWHTFLQLHKKVALGS